MKLPTPDTGHFGFPEISTGEVTAELCFIKGSEDQGWRERIFMGSSVISSYQNPRQLVLRYLGCSTNFPAI